MDVRTAIWPWFRAAFDPNEFMGKEAPARLNDERRGPR
jgi:hypothetical protein